jgi:hypothetical protein
MFWSHENQDAAESIGRYVREELRLRLRVAADFATLGAYELLEGDEAPVERAAPEATRKAPPKAAPKRVLLFAKVAPVCPHSAVPAEPGCTRRAPGRLGGRRQRGGSVRAPEQPCVDAGARVSV